MLGETACVSTCCRAHNHIISYYMSYRKKIVNEFLRSHDANVTRTDDVLRCVDLRRLGDETERGGTFLKYV